MLHQALQQRAGQRLHPGVPPGVQRSHGDARDADGRLESRQDGAVVSPGCDADRVVLHEERLDVVAEAGLAVDDLHSLPGSRRRPCRPAVVAQNRRDGPVVRVRPALEDAVLPPVRRVVGPVAEVAVRRRGVAPARRRGAEEVGHARARAPGHVRAVADKVVRVRRRLSEPPQQGEELVGVRAAREVRELRRHGVLQRQAAELHGLHGAAQGVERPGVPAGLAGRRRRRRFVHHSKPGRAGAAPVAGRRGGRRQGPSRG